MLFEDICGFGINFEKMGMVGWKGRVNGDVVYQAVADAFDLPFRNVEQYLKTNQQ